MAETSQYKFALEEVAALLAKEAGITEGLWTIGVNFLLGATNAGPSEDRIRPSAIISVDQLVLTKAETPGPLTIDLGNKGADPDQKAAASASDLQSPTQTRKT